MGAVRRRHAAPDVLADQELHVDGGRPGPGRGQAEHRRSGAEVLPRRDAGGRQRLPEGHADPRPAGDVDGAPDRAVVPGQHDVDEDVLRASRAAQAGHDLPLQHAGQLHALGHRAEGHRPEGSRLPAVAALHAARHRHAALGDEPRGRQHRRLRPVAAHRGHRALRPALSAEGPVAGQAARAGRLGRGGDDAADVERQQPDVRLGSGLRLPVLALAQQVVPRRRRARPVLHGAAGAGHRHRDDQRHAQHAGRDERGLGEAAAGAGRRPSCPRTWRRSRRSPIGSPS